MGTGKHDNYTYYKGFEGEGAFMITLAGTTDDILHIWEGYVSYILEDPGFFEEGWKGLTRDYQEMRGAWSDDETYTTQGKAENQIYYDDLLRYKGKAFDDAETSEVLNVLLSIFREAIDKGLCVQMWSD